MITIEPGLIYISPSLFLFFPLNLFSLVFVRRNKKRKQLKLTVKEAMLKKKFHQATQPQEILVTMTEADFGPGHEHTSVELLVLGQLYLRSGRLAFAEQILLRSFGIFVLLQGTAEESQYRLPFLQTVHYLALTLELSGDEEKISYARSLHQAAWKQVKGLTNEQTDEKSELLLWKTRLGMALQNRLKLDGEQFAVAMAPVASVSQSKSLTLIAYDQKLLEQNLHDATNALNSQVILDMGLTLSLSQGSSVNANSNAVNIETKGETKNEENVQQLQLQVSENLKSNNFQEARDQQIKCVKLTMNEFGMIHENSADSLDLLGLICESMSEWKDSIAVHRHALGIRMSTLGVTHAATIRSIGRLGKSLDKLAGEDKEIAECLLLAAAALYNKHVIVGISNTSHARSSGLRMLTELSAMYERRGEHEKSKVYSMHT